MKYSWLFGLLLPVLVWAQAVDTTFSELRGMQDAGGNTHLFYRKHSLYQDSLSYIEKNHIYHMDLTQGADTLFLEDFVTHTTLWDEARVIREFLFFDQNPAHRIVAGEYIIVDPDGYIERYDVGTVFIQYGQMWFMAQSQQNPNLLYAFHEMALLLRSRDRGYTWQPDSLAPMEMMPISLSPFNDQILFALHRWFNGRLYKSTDGGHTYALVDTSTGWSFYSTQLYYDADGQHLYATVNGGPVWGYHLLRSADAGESWQIVRTSSGSVRLATDPAYPGRLFLGEGDTLWRSEDFGNSFTLYWPLRLPIVDIYAPPGSDPIYVATLKDIYQVTATDTVSIKHISGGPQGIGDEDWPLLQGFQLLQNYPNPFNPATTIEFVLPRAVHVRLEVFDVLGQRVKVLVDGRRLPGRHRVIFTAERLPAGVYLYRLSAGTFRQWRKMVLVK